MNKSLKVTLLVVLSLALVYAVMMFAGCSSSSSSSDTPAAKKPTYTGTIYMASELGGHIGIYDVTIDPNNTTNPITINTSARKQLSGSPGVGSTLMNINHDVRYDDAAKKVYFAAIIPDDAFGAGTLSKARLGYMDVSTVSSSASPVVTDATVDVETDGAKNVMNLKFPTTGDAVVGLPVIYCASGQASLGGTDYFIGLSMTVPAYIDTFKKSDIVAGADLSGAKRTRIHVEDFRGSWNDAGVSLFAHGIASNPTGSVLYVAVNEVTVTNYDATTFTPTGYPKGQVTGYLLKMSDVISGTTNSTTSVINKNTISGLGGSQTTAPTVAFRAGWTPDGTKILQSGKDRFLVLDGTTLAPLNGAAGDATIGGGKAQLENHDAMSTPDGKYAILAIRYEDSDTAGTQTSGLQLYDLTAMKPVGAPTATCSSCHASGSLTTANHLTCGLDGKLTTH